MLSRRSVGALVPATFRMLTACVQIRKLVILGLGALVRVGRDQETTPTDRLPLDLRVQDQVTILSDPDPV